MSVKISVVIPFYNTRDCVEALYQRLSTSLSKISSDYEIICVDDASPQEDWKLISKLGQTDKRVKLIKFTRNFGQQTAISAGIHSATGDWVVVMDADLQDRPEEIPRLYQKASEGFEIVYARRAVRKDTMLKRIYSTLFNGVFAKLTGIEMDKTIGNFGIYSRKTVNAYVSMNEQFRGFGLLISWMGFKSAKISVEHQERTIGKTSYTFYKGLRLALDAFIAFSDKPLKITALFGFGLSSFAFIVGIVYLIRGLLGDVAIVGWSSLIISIWFLGGITILLIGVIGLYLGKVFDESKKRPHYIVDYTINIDEEV